jgi:hypothetical protein
MLASIRIYGIATIVHNPCHPKRELNGSYAKLHKLSPTKRELGRPNVTYYQRHREFCRDDAAEEEQSDCCQSY